MHSISKTSTNLNLNLKTEVKQIKSVQGILLCGAFDCSYCLIIALSAVGGAGVVIKSTNRYRLNLICN